VFPQFCSVKLMCPVIKLCITVFVIYCALKKKNIYHHSVNWESCVEPQQLD